MKITTIGIDLAKNVFQLHGVDEKGHTVLRRQLKRDKVLGFFANLEPCVIGMEACSSSNHWARELAKLGHTPKLMAPQFVKPYVKTNKNDAADAEAICEAVRRPSMRFVPVKSQEQQAVLALHRARQGFVTARTAQANQIRGFMAEHGIVIPQGIRSVIALMPGIVENADNDIPDVLRLLIMRLLKHFNELDRQVKELEAQILAWHRESEACRRITEIPGVGPLTASAIVATVGDARVFKSGRQFAAWMGLVPRQHSSGGKQNLLGISKRGDGYLRCLLIHGARAVVGNTTRKRCETGGWVGNLLKRRPSNVVTVALANKNARIVWALLAHERKYSNGYAPLCSGA